MVINHATLQSLRTAVRTELQRGIESVEQLYTKVAMTIPSTTLLNTYGWMEGLPGVQEWIGQREFGNLKERAMQVQNKLWTSGISIKRTAIEDDNLGMYTPAINMLGSEAAEHPEILFWDVLENGFDATYGLAWDGQYFIDADHLTWDANGNETTFSNDGGGAGAAWFLADLSRPVRPMIFQRRTEIELQVQDRPEQDSVFELDEYRYATRARYNVGYGLFQFIYGSKDTLNETNVVAGRTGLMSQHKPSGAKLRVQPNTIICGPSNLQAALEIAQAERKANGETNVWRGRFQVIEVPYLT